jgi:hypothetical protein
MPDSKTLAINAEFTSAVYLSSLTPWPLDTLKPVFSSFGSQVRLPVYEETAVAVGTDEADIRFAGAGANLE